MLVAICEDNTAYNDVIAFYCRNWQQKHTDVDLSIHQFSTPDALINKYERPYDYDLYFLDIEFDADSSMNGYRLAELIREHNNTSLLVFITNSRNYMQRGYTVSAYRYLVKPITQENISDCLNQCLKETLSFPASFLAIEKKEGTSRVRLRDIVSIESGLHSVTIRTVSSEITAHNYESFENYCNGLPDGWFIRCQKGLLVNMTYINRFTKNVIYLTTGTDYPIGRIYRKNVQKRLQQFFMGGTDDTI